MPRNERFPWDDAWTELSLDELLQILGGSSGAAEGSGEDEDSGEPCLVRGEGDPGWYWGDEVLDEDER